MRLLESCSPKLEPGVCAGPLLVMREEGGCDDGPGAVSWELRGRPGPVNGQVEELRLSGLGDFTHCPLWLLACCLQPASLC